MGLLRPVPSMTTSSRRLPSADAMTRSRDIVTPVAARRIRSPRGDHAGIIVQPGRRESRDAAPRVVSIVQVMPAPVRSSSRSAATALSSGERATWIHRPGSPSVPSGLPARSNQVSCVVGVRSAAKASTPVLDADRPLTPVDSHALRAITTGSPDTVRADASKRCATTSPPRT